MTLEIALCGALGLLIAACQVADWRVRRTPIGRLNAELAETRQRRRGG